MPTADRKLTMEELGRPDAETFRAMPKNRLRFILDDVRSRHNTGSLFRTADAFAMHGLDLCGFTPLPPHREMEKTALGATLTVPWEHHASAAEAVRKWKAAGWQVWAVEQTVQAVPVTAWRPDLAKGTALVLGNELHGVHEAVVALCDGAVVVPQGGTKHSLNVSVCGGIVAAMALFGTFPGSAATVPHVLR
ncbi:MAG: TrmH family RNA methyltransferase [Flavobacteriales bacterium]|nr:TrmH family RNA methyltransferase [Flavobacteriales bacterium]MEB2342092.1 TrmH family RNA methyltransferase [Flavobacteriia bacterium]